MNAGTWLRSWRKLLLQSRILGQEAQAIPINLALVSWPAAKRIPPAQQPLADRASCHLGTWRSQAAFNTSSAGLRADPWT